MGRAFGPPWADVEGRRVRRAMGTLSQRDRDLLGLFANNSIPQSHPGVEDALAALKEALS